MRIRQLGLIGAFLLTAWSANAVNVGQKAPLFALKDTDGSTVALEEYRGSTVVIEFYRGLFCPFCNEQLAGYQKVLGDLEAEGIALLAISVDPPNLAQTMRDRHMLTFPLLQDPDLATIVAYDVKAPFLDLAAPTTFIVDGDGIVRFKYVDPFIDTRISPADIRDNAIAINNGETPVDPLPVEPQGNAATTWANLKR